MSGLAAVLSGRERPGVHRWDSALDAEDVRRSAAVAGWRCAVLDTVGVQTRAELLTALGQALEFGPHYGHNLDALHDCLRDLGGPTVLLWEGWATPAVAEPRLFATVLRILGDDAGRPGALEVLLQGPGPEDAAPLLA